MGRIFKAILVLIVAGVLGTLGYAYFGDMSAEPVEIRNPVALPDLAQAPPAPAVPLQALTPGAPAEAPAPASAPAAAPQSAPAPAAAGAGLDE